MASHATTSNAAHACQARQAWLMNGKALDQGLEGYPLANVAESGPIKIKAERIAWAVAGTVQPNELGIGINEATDQPGTGTGKDKDHQPAERIAAAVKIAS